MHNSNNIFNANVYKINHVKFCIGKERQITNRYFIN